MKSVCLQFLIVMLFACNDNALVYSKDIFHKSVVNESLQTPHKKNELFSNYGIAQDRDGYVKLRAKPSVKSKIKTKIPSGEIIYIFSEDSVATGWYIIDYYVSDGKLVTGYVHKSRIKLIDSFKNIPAIFQNVSSATFIAKDVTLVLNAGNPITTPAQINHYTAADKKAVVHLKQSCGAQTAHPQQVNIKAFL